MPDEVIKYLHITKKDWYLDATLGVGGHTIAILGSGGNVLGLDADPKMLEIAKKNISKACPANNKERFVGLNYNFSNLDKALVESGIDTLSGALFDLGISSYHLDTDDRGFSFQNKLAPLDMRLDPKLQNIKAADLLNVLDKAQLVVLFQKTMLLPKAKKLAKSVTNRRKTKRFETVSDFLKLFPKRTGKTHPATTAFLSLRIAVNTELDALNGALDKILDFLKPGGRIVVISFHSGEDRIVKHKFNLWQKEGLGQVLTDKPVLPSKNEVNNNPRARSAKLRTFAKKYE